MHVEEEPSRWMERNRLVHRNHVDQISSTILQHEVIKMASSIKFTTQSLKRIADLCSEKVLPQEARRRWASVEDWRHNLAYIPGRVGPRHAADSQWERRVRIRRGEPSSIRGRRRSGYGSAPNSAAESNLGTRERRSIANPLA
jgi:hypothetical protein